MTNLNELMLHGNLITNTVGLDIAQCLRHTDKLQKLWMQNNLIDSAGKEAIQSELSHLKNLNRLEL